MVNERQVYSGTLRQYVLVEYPFTVPADSPEDAEAAIRERPDDVEWEGRGDIFWGETGPVVDVVIDPDPL